MTTAKIPSFFTRLTKDEKTVIDSLIEGKGLVQPTLNVTTFTSRYLPLLYNFYTGEVGLEEISKYRTIWINEVAGTGHTEVNVVDDNGATVVIVPPVLGAIQYVPKDKNFSISDTLKTYSDIRSHRNEVQANKHLRGTIFNAHINHADSHESRWVELFKLFKCSPQSAQTNTKSTNDIIPFSDDSEMIYEP